MGHSTVASYRPTKTSTSRVRAAPRPVPQPSWLLLIIVTATVAGVVWGLMQQRRAQVDPRQVIAINLAAGELAFEHARYFEPAEHSAVHYFNAVLALQPTHTRALQRLDEIAHHYAEQAKKAILDAHFADAAVAIEHLRRVRADDRRLVYLETELRKALDVHVALLAAIEQPRLVTLSEQSSSGHATKQSNQSSSGALPIVARDAQPVAVKQSEPTRIQPALPTDDVSADMSRAPPLQSGGASSGRPNEVAPAFIPASTRTEQADAQTEQALSLSARAAEPQPTQARANTSGMEPIPTQMSGAQPAASVEASEPSESSPIEVSARWLPTAIKLVEPNYPEAAQVRGIEGWVDLMLTVAPSGEVIDAQVRDREGSRSFERAALHAVRQWRYEPNAAGASAPAQHIPARVAFKLE